MTLLYKEEEKFLLIVNASLNNRFFLFCYRYDCVQCITDHLFFVFLFCTDRFN